MPVELVQLNLQHLVLLDPRIGAMVEADLATIARDCMNRPTDTRARKLVLQFEITPVPDIDPQDSQSVSCDRVQVSLQSKTTLPNRKTAVFPMDVSKGGMRFNADLPSNLDQQTLFPRSADPDPEPRPSTRTPPPGFGG